MPFGQDQDNTWKGKR